jgi:uncharacterized protein YndB with AHSA1/START domain
MEIEILEMTRVPTVTTGMLIRKPATEVFQAIVDPAITTRFWFTDSTGKVTPGADLRWTWSMYDHSTHVSVQDVEQDRMIRFEWNDEKPTTVEMRFIPSGDDATYVQVTVSGFVGDGDEVAALVADSSAGFATVLCALKALLEHGLVLTAVADHAPPAGLAM